MKKKLNILIVEDNDSDADLLYRELKKTGLDFITEIVETKADFENALEKFSPDIILSDFSLPAFDAVSAFRIKQIKCPLVPFIIVSGTIGDENAVDLIKEGVTDYALKDKLYALPNKINRALKEATDERQKREADEELKLQNRKLLEIAFLQTHEVRIPVSEILALFTLVEFDNPAAPINREILTKLKAASESLHRTINQIIEKTSHLTNAIR